MMAKRPLMYANLHTHTTHSDGVYSPAEMARVAKEEGYSAIAVTDHDTVTGNDAIRAECVRLGMETIFGCEFMTHSDVLGLDFHLTAFDFDAELPEMKEYLRKCSFTMTERTRACFEIGKEKGLLPKEIEWQHVLSDEQNEGISWICNDHVFRTMKKMGLAEDKDYPPFLEGIFFKYWKAVPDAYPKLPLEELVPLIRRANGVVIVAHPHGAIDKIPYLAKQGIEGLEVWHPDLTAEEIPAALLAAAENKMYISGGPDHSGICGGQYPFYEDYTSCPYYIPDFSTGTTKEFFDEIKNRTMLGGREDIIYSYVESYKHN